ncbi:hypothetical protein BOTBODRAFT_149076 [Botryobasidium botryosum FD-172 SS1]|uniref:Uncharacterized protein n=1 Tax=Botryobasidium botryosum (strain FD-172 SS1) TaxID=930990 RepID=A0A067M751_BOTB1|nr:hypothetical protein BOTBODRAFT_149076 [Botryobasidium botryosum FD-172 SS1]
MLGLAHRRRTTVWLEQNELKLERIQLRRDSHPVESLKDILETCSQMKDVASGTPTHAQPVVDLVPPRMAHLNRLEILMVDRHLMYSLLAHIDVPARARIRLKIGVMPANTLVDFLPRTSPKAHGYHLPNWAHIHTPEVCVTSQGWVVCTWQDGDNVPPIMLGCIKMEVQDHRCMQWFLGDIKDDLPHPSLYTVHFPSVCPEPRSGQSVGCVFGHRLPNVHPVLGNHPSWHPVLRITGMQPRRRVSEELPRSFNYLPIIGVATFSPCPLAIFRAFWITERTMA